MGCKLRLDVRASLPEEFDDVELRGLEAIFPNPTLVHLRGENSTALFVSVVLHGNEDAGVLAIQQLMKSFSLDELPRDILLFVGNVRASSAGVRFLSDQVDFNRAWPGSDLPDSPTHELLNQTLDTALDLTNGNLFASVDIHNNTGRNPHYGCICSLKPKHVQLASRFSDKTVYLTRPKGLQTQAFQEYCPSVAIECGRTGTYEGAREAARFLSECLHLDDLWEQAQQAGSVFEMVARIHLKDQVSVGFEPGNDVVLRQDLDLLNFRQLPAGEVLGTLNRSLDACFEVYDQDGNIVTQDFLNADQQRLTLGRTVMPSMLTKDLKVMRQDCVGYLMQGIAAS